MAKKTVKVWVEETTTVKLYLVPPTALKGLLKLIGEYEHKEKAPKKKK